MTPNDNAFKKGDRVAVTKWAHRGEVFLGAVTGADGDSVFVQYDNSFVEDELDHADVRRLPCTHEGACGCWELDDEHSVRRFDHDMDGY